MSIIGWILLGLISGFIASKIVNKTGEGVILDIVLGVVGAIVGGFLFAQFGAQGVTGFNLYSMFVAVIGAIVVLVHLPRRRRPSFDLELRRSTGHRLDVAIAADLILGNRHVHFRLDHEQDLPLRRRRR